MLDSHIQAVLYSLYELHDFIIQSLLSTVYFFLTIFAFNSYINVLIFIYYIFLASCGGRKTCAAFSASSAPGEYPTFAHKMHHCPSKHLSVFNTFQKVSSIKTQMITAFISFGPIITYFIKYKQRLQRFYGKP